MKKVDQYLEDLATLFDQEELEVGKHYGIAQVVGSDAIPARFLSRRGRVPVACLLFSGCPSNKDGQPFGVSPASFLAGTATVFIASR